MSPLKIVFPIVLIAGFGALVVRAQGKPQGPVPIVWDEEACADCRMHVGEPSFAAQAQLEDGRVLNFDDPGCLMSWLDEHKDPLHAVWLHHSSRDEWIAKDEVGFVLKDHTPMAFGLGATRADEPGAMSWQEARAHLDAKKGHH